MNDALRRSLRGLIQVGFVMALCQGWDAFFNPDLTTQQLTAITVIFTPVVSFVQNMLEDHTAIPALLKGPASSGLNPTPDPSSGMVSKL